MKTYQQQNKPFAIDAQLLFKELQNGALLLDVRYIHSVLTTGSIANALFIGVQGNLEGWAQVLINKKSTPIFLLKEDDSDFETLKNRLQQVGFERVMGFLAGGIDAWKAQGFAIEPYHAVHPAEFAHTFDSINSNSIIDVRTQREFEHQHLKGSRNIPLDQLHQFIKTLTNENPYYMICAGGYRSVIAASILKQNHICNTIDVYGGIKNFH